MNAPLRLACLTVPLLAAAASGCAHAPPAGTDTAAGSEAPAGKDGAPVRAKLQDPGVGYSFDLPPGAEFRPRSGRDNNVVAGAPDGTVLRVFVEHFARAADEPACWQRLYERLPEGVNERPASPGELAAKARAGIVRAGRRLSFAAFPRASSCLVLVVDGPEGSTIARDAAELGFRTFVVTAPTGFDRVRLAFEAGIQLLEGDKRDAPVALDRFEEALAADPSFKRAHLGAGLAAFFAGDAYAAKAIQHLEIVLADRDDRTQDPDDALEPAQLKDALMYLGLAYAEEHNYVKASAQLAETVARFPDDSIALYNFACVLALGGEADEALHNLDEAFTRDPALKGHAVSDTDLDALHARREWRELVGDGAPPAP